MHYLKLFLINALAINSTKQSSRVGGVSGKVCENFKAFLSFFCCLLFYSALKLLCGAHLLLIKSSQK